MPILKLNGTIEKDVWTRIDAEDEIPATGDIVVPLASLLTGYSTLRNRDGRLGVAISNDQEVSVLTTFFGGLDLIVLDFPAFSDGRAFSQGRALRQNGFEGELRADGDVLPDQLQFMKQVGFNSFFVTDRFSDVAWKEALETISLSYQQNSHGTPSVWTARQRNLKGSAEAAPWIEQPHAG